MNSSKTKTNMEIKRAEFVCSNTDYSKCPKSEKPEFAFIGRSNVGKSSLINRLTNRNKLAKVSGSPGKTQLINHFIINDSWYLVDLPGYGYAKVSKKSRETWGRFVKDYILKRENLFNLFVLVDSRHEPQKQDIEFINWLGQQAVPFSIVFTKTDKLSSQKVDKNLVVYKNELKKYWEEIPPVFLTSAEKGAGKEELLNYIEQIMKIVV